MITQFLSLKRDALISWKDFYRLNRLWFFQLIFISDFWFFALKSLVLLHLLKKEMQLGKTYSEVFLCNGFQVSIWLCSSSFLLFRTCNGCIFFLGNLMWLLFVYWKKLEIECFLILLLLIFLFIGVLLCVYIISPCFSFFKMEYYLNWRNCIYATYRFARIADILHWLLSAGMIW